MCRPLAALLAGAILAGCANIDYTGTGRPLTADAVKNAKYRVVHNGGEPFVLVNGRNEAVPTRAADRKMSVAMADPMGFGDLNGDGAIDAVVVLVSDLGGSGSYVTLAAVLNDRGLADHAANADLGDRTRVKSIRVEKSLVTVDVLRAGPDDPLCCPTEQATLRFMFEDGRLNPL